MNKGVWIGAGLGLLVLAGLGGYWLSLPESPARLSPSDAQVSAVPPGTDRKSPAGSAVRAPEGASAEAGAPRAEAPAGVVQPPWVLPPGAAVAGVEAGQGTPGVNAGATSALSREERRQRRAQMRARLAQLQAKGPSATIEDTRQAMADVERLGAGMVDPTYFRAIQDLLTQAERADALSAEYGRIAQSRKPQDVARQQAILAEFRAISQRTIDTSKIVQSYAATQMGGHPATASGGKPATGGKP